MDDGLEVAPPDDTVVSTVGYPVSMRTWAECVAACFVLLVAWLSLHPDLRGQAPAGWYKATTVKRLNPEETPFSVDDCLPGSIDAYGAPTREENDGTATMTVFTCRSRSSVWTAICRYLIAVSIYPVWLLFKRWRTERP